MATKAERTEFYNSLQNLKKEKADAKKSEIDDKSENADDKSTDDTSKHDTPKHEIKAIIKPPAKSSKPEKPKFDIELSKKLVGELLDGKKASKEPLFVGLYGLSKSLLAGDLMKELSLTPSEGIVISSEHFLMKLPDAQKDLAECKKFYNTISSLPDESDITYSKCLEAQLKYGRTAWNLIFKDLYSGAKNKKLNIFYEFTGRNMGMLKYMIPDLKALGYRIKIVYPISNNDKLYEQMLEYSKKFGVANNKTHINTLIKESENNIAEIANLVDDLYIFDVNNKPKKMFESIDGKIKCSVDPSQLEGRSAEFKKFIETKCSKSGSGQTKKLEISQEDREFLENMPSNISFDKSGDSSQKTTIGGCDSCGGLKKLVLIIAVLCLILIVIFYGNVEKNLNVSAMTVFKLVGLGAISVIICAWCVK